MAVSAEQITAKSNPFSDTVDSSNYFEDEQRAEISQKIAHLLEFGSDILFIRSELESGKTTLIKHLIEEKQPHWRCCYTNAEQANSVNSFLAILARSFQIRETQPEAILNKLADYLTEAHDKGKLTVLFVDDADKLDPSLFKLITSIAAIYISGQPVLRIALIGREIPAILKQLVAQGNSREHITVTEVPAFNEEQTGIYIQHRLAAMDFDQQSQFTPSVVEKIFKQSRGQPSHINALAHSKITQPESTAHSEALQLTKKNSAANNHFVLKLIALALAISVVVSLFFFRSDKSLTPNPPEPIAQKEKTLAIPAPQVEPKEEPVPAKIIPEPPQQTNEAAKEIKTEETSTSPIVTTEAPARPEAKPEPIQDSVTTPSEASANTKENGTAVNKASIVAPKNDTKNEEWIKTRPATHFTLQLIALGSAEAAQKYIKDNNIEQQAAFFKTSKNNKIYYAVVFGDFASRQAAQNSIRQLPASLSKIKPWIRSYASIQRSQQ